MLVAEKKLTVREYLQMDFGDEDAYYELINGEIMRKAAPSPMHQNISMFLSSLMHVHVLQHELGRILTAPTDVFLDDYNHHQPDIFFIRQDNLHIINYKEGIFGVPDLIVEIISPGSILIDREEKKLAYLINGVREYWLIDPNNRSVEVYENKAGKFEATAFAVESGVVRSQVLAGFEVEVATLFPANL